MLRFIWVIVSCLFLIMYYVPKMSYYARHPEKYGEDICYQMAQVMCNHVRRRAFIKTVATGMENLPKEGGYIMYANHQGKYDVLGVIVSHDKPITYVMDAKRSKLFIADQLTDLVKAQRLDKEDIKQQVQVINDVSTEIKAGRRYILFPREDTITVTMSSRSSCREASRSPRRRSVLSFQSCCMIPSSHLRDGH